MTNTPPIYRADEVGLAMDFIRRVLFENFGQTMQDDALRHAAEQLCKAIPKWKRTSDKNPVSGEFGSYRGFEPLGPFSHNTIFDLVKEPLHDRETTRVLFGGFDDGSS